MYHPVQAKKSSCPKSFRSLAKLNINVYINTVGSATPSISSGCPPTIEWMIPQRAVDARVCTAVKVPSVTNHQKKSLYEQICNQSGKGKRTLVIKRVSNLCIFPTAPQKI